MKALIVDDERLGRNALRRLLKEHPDVEIVAEAANAEEALRAVRKNSPDIIFLDVEMPKCSGFELLEKMEDVPAVIFTTAFDQYAVHAFEVNAMDYLLKPISSERLASALARAEKALGPTSRQSMQEKDSGIRQIFVRDGDRCWIVRIADIALMESEGNYTRLHFAGNAPLIYRSLTAIEEKLSPASFFRANRSQIVNLRWIDNVRAEIEGRLVVALKNGKQVEVSRRQSRRLRELLSL